jgi:Zn-dependent peptidase ImmA (M78 family)/transcriptional regulator with XRE-family HTH domain
MKNLDIKKTLGQRISRRREALGLTQKDLATQIGFGSSEIISQIELGKREVKAWELSQIAQILHANIADFLIYKETDFPPPILWRISPSEQQEAKEAKFLNFCQQYSLLENLSGTTIRKPLPEKIVDPSMLSFGVAESLAIEVRKELGLGDRPASVLVKTLEDKYGVKILYEYMDEGSAATTIGDFGPAILMNKREAPWRRNFNFAHEIFHIITWKSIPAKILKRNRRLWDDIERKAEVFASCLLLPEESIGIEIEERKINKAIEYSDLIEIARKYDVSTQALLYRLLNMRLINRKNLTSTLKDEKFLAFDRSTMHVHWWEPPRLPERYVRLAFVAYQKGKLSRAKLARMLGVNLPNVSHTLQSYGLEDSQFSGKITMCAS